MVERHHRLYGHEFEQSSGDGEGQGSLACCSPWGHKESDTTERLHNDNDNQQENESCGHPQMPMALTLTFFASYDPDLRQNSSFFLSFLFGHACQNPGEGNGTPLQYSCLENPRDRGAWWAAVYGVAQSRTRLKRLSSSSSQNLSSLTGD